MKKIEIEESCKLINQHFELQNIDLLPESIDTFALLKQELAKVISHLLNTNFERLLQIMYRIDVSEDKFKNTFLQKENIAESIADLVIERELQKVQSRLKYRDSL